MLFLSSCRGYHQCGKLGLVAEALTIQALEEFRPIVIGATAGTMVGGAFTLAASRSLWVALLVSTGLPLILTVNSLAMIDATAFNLLFGFAL